MTDKTDTGTKSAYIKKRKAQLEELSAEIDQLKARASQKEAAARLKIYAVVQRLEKRRDALREQVEAVGKAADNAWEELKRGVEAAWLELKDALPESETTAEPSKAFDDPSAFFESPTDVLSDDRFDSEQKRILLGKWEILARERLGVSPEPGELAAVESAKQLLEQSK